MKFTRGFDLKILFRIGSFTVAIVQYFRPAYCLNVNEQNWFGIKNRQKFDLR